ncbi:MAG: RNA polymerase sigma factor [Lysobacteraceae bacterium]|nr:RNA polymerase sigma factor [Xanthomonadaceae bacterium]HRX98910.1 RNA polymerase sigma factor [Xanthomonadaceae bacterium]
MTTAGGDDPDLPLVIAIGQGDASAAATLVDRYARRLQAFAWRMLGDREEAEDVVQDSFLRLWKHARRWKPGAARFSTWLYQVAANGCRDRLRKRRDHSAEAVDWLVDDTPGGREQLQQAERDAVVQQAVNELPDRQREALLLSHYDGMGNPDIAAVLEVSVEAVESLLARARRRLRDELAPLKTQGKGESS